MAYNNGMLLECMYVPKTAKRNITQHANDLMVVCMLIDDAAPQFNIGARPWERQGNLRKFRHDTQTQYDSEKNPSFR